MLVVLDLLLEYQHPASSTSAIFANGSLWFMFCCLMTNNKYPSCAQSDRFLALAKEYLPKTLSVQYSNLANEAKQYTASIEP